MSARAFTEADVRALVAAFVPAVVEAFESDPPKPQTSSALRIGVEVGILLAREPLLGSNEVDDRIRGRREVVQEAVRLAKAALLGARTSCTSSESDRIPSAEPAAGSDRFPDAPTATYADGGHAEDGEDAT